MPEHLKTGLELAKTAELSNTGQEINSVIVLGMGGSAIGGDIVKGLTEQDIQVPFFINRHYDVPCFLDSSSLVIASSYSGNTEETLSALDKLTSVTKNIVVISSGGKISDLASEKNWKLIQLPNGFPPRSALGFTISAIMSILHSYGLIRDFTEDILKASILLNDGNDLYSPSDPTNPAIKASEKILRKLPVIYSDSRIWKPVGQRIKGQLCENAKMAAFYSEIPEMNHNEVVGLTHFNDLTKHFQPIIIRDRSSDYRVNLRLDLISEIYQESGIESVIFEPKGDTLTERILSTIQFGDYLSYYSAVLSEIDPTPIDIIDRLKKRLDSSLVKGVIT
jgi:glucose/mannose-6-phosphate isomerase